MEHTHPSHKEDLVRLRRIEGQVRGIQKMVEEGRYCIDILTQLGSIAGALMKVEENILSRHLRSCVRESLAEGDRADQDRKIGEIIEILAKFRRRSA